MPASEPRVPSRPAVVAGLVAGVVGGFVWALIVAYTGYEVGWVAWGVGALVGFVMAAVSPVRSTGMGIRAAVLAAVGLIVGKWLIVEFAAVPQMRDEILGDSLALEQVVFVDMVERDQLPSDIVTDLARSAPDDSVAVAARTRLSDALDERIAAMSEAERESVATRYARAVVSDLGFVDRIRATLSAWDLLWFFLAVGTAWKLTAGSAEVVPAEEPEGDPPGA